MKNVRVFLKNRGYNIRETRFAAFVMVPILALFFGAVIGPVLYAFIMTFFQWDGLVPLMQSAFVGFGNYVRALTDMRFLRSIYNTLYFSIGVTVIIVPLSLMVAIMLNSLKYLKRFEGIGRVLAYLPVFLPGVTVAILWRQLLYQPAFGLVNQLLSVFNLGPFHYLYNPDIAMNSIIVTEIWRRFGYYAIIFLAGLQGIPSEYEDCAKVDGANKFQTFWKITLPLLKPTTLFVLVINIIMCMRVFSLVYAMTRGGPLRSTEVTVLLAYDTAFGRFQLSYGATMTVILFFIVLVLTIIQMRIMKKGGMQQY